MIVSKSIEELQAEIDNLNTKNKGLKDRLEKIATVGVDGHWDWHLKEDYEYMDARFWEIFGYLPEEKEHSPSAWMDIIHPEDLKKAIANLEKHVESKGKSPYFQKVRYKHKDGHWVTVICRGTVVEWDTDGSAIRMVGTHTDITEMEKGDE